MAEPAPAPRRRPTVAVTRSVEANRSLIERLEPLGFAVVAVPLVEVVAPADGGTALASALADLTRYQWVVLTSANAVRSVAGTRGHRPWPRDVSVAVVGPATAGAARSAGLPVDLVPEVATAASLVQAFPTASDRATGAGRVLAPLAQLASDTVPAGLADKGWEVDRVEAYRTVDPGDGDQPDGGPGAMIDAVAFFSPSAVDRWVDRFGAEVPLAVCVGPTTAARARDRGLIRTVEAAPHDETGVVSALDDLLRPRG